MRAVTSSAKGLASGLSWPVISRLAVPWARPRSSRSAICGGWSGKAWDENAPRRPASALRSAE